MVVMAPSGDIAMQQRDLSRPDTGGILAPGFNQQAAAGKLHGRQKARRNVSRPGRSSSVWRHSCIPQPSRMRVAALIR